MAEYAFKSGAAQLSTERSITKLQSDWANKRHGKCLNLCLIFNTFNDLHLDVLVF